MSSEEFAKLRQSHLIRSTARRNDGVHMRVVSERKPNTDARPAVATLEDAYLYFIQRTHLSERGTDEGESV